MIVHVLHCGWCKKPFSYDYDGDSDCCRPDSPNIICTPCFEFLEADAKLAAERDDAMMAASMEGLVS